ncbi:hypothetical protein BN341_10630 [Helicobacter heilmannii ASB1.4]|uniref:Uncharacterized protein n=1 Tax=Helicobacter heilmannii TaxID=35817 RepID=A0A0K2YC84_HELHE|nr:hypothetical protein BN341_10630 [Helicobacter heilmannii ASB1.4]CRI34590.1 hypothetical protein HHE01_03910 [Helicobacter heilmannii]
MPLKWCKIHKNKNQPQPPKKGGATPSARAARGRVLLESLLEHSTG